MTNKFNFFRDVIQDHAVRQPDQDALVWIDQSANQHVTSFAEIARRASKAAGLLNGLGLARGDRLLVILGREHIWWEVMLGCLAAGIIPVPGTTQLSARDIGHRLKASGAKAIIAGDAAAAATERAIVGHEPILPLIHAAGARPGWIDYADAIAPAAPIASAADTSADDDALCYFTSGTAGYPKMTMHRHDYALGHRATGRDWLAVGPGDRCWNLSDTGWAKAAWSSLFAPWLQGATIVAHDAPGFDARLCWSVLAQAGVNTLCAPPTAYRMMLNCESTSAPLPALRHCVAAGEPLGRDIIEAWHERTGLTIREGYGQTETPLLCAMLPGMEHRPGSMGKPVAGLQLEILAEDGSLAGIGVEGEIVLDISGARPTGLFDRYDGVDRSMPTGSWHKTGDRGWKDGDGYFWFLGRDDDIILSSGYRIGPFEVETALNSHAAVLESAVVSSPDPVRGEIVKAFVVLQEGTAPDDELVTALQTHVKGETAPYKYPRSICFVETLPKTVSGKILRRQLRDQEWVRGPSGP